MQTPNPFTPAFGTIPINVAGRDKIFEDMRHAFQTGPGNPNLSTILIGPRGSGKTVCMRCICDEALKYGWISVRTTAKSGMLEDIYEQALEASAEFMEAKSAKLSSLSLGPVAASWNIEEQPQGNWRTRMSKILKTLNEHDTGLVISVDEVRANEQEMIDLASVFQLFVVEERKVALLMAGLPYHVDSLLSNESVSFLRRSMQYHLENIDNAEVSASIEKTIVDAGKSIDPNALEACVNAAQGFAYMIQLVGYRTWARSRESKIALTDAEYGIADAWVDMEEHIYRATYRELSDVDLAFIEAMLEDPVESRLSDVAKRLGVKSNYASKYKLRLLRQGVIEERGRNSIFAFAIPGFREFIKKERRA